MRVTNAVATSCASLGDVTVKAILESSNHARNFRESRHDLSVINAELLSLKVTVEILQDDFSTKEDAVPLPVSGAVSGTLDCCNATIARLRDLIAALPRCKPHRGSWGPDTDATSTKELRTARHCLDLALDHVSLFTDSRNEAQGRGSSPTNDLERLTQARRVLELLRRTGFARDRLQEQTSEQSIAMASHLCILKKRAEALHEELTIDEEEPKRSDSMDPEDEASIKRNEQTSSRPLPSESTPAGIGTWIANVASASRNVCNPNGRHELLTNPIHKQREETKAQHAEAKTFYNESTTSSSLAAPRNRQYRSRPQKTRPQTALRRSKPKSKMLYASSSTTESEAPIHNGLDRYINADKVAIARSKRENLSLDERVAIDWRLRTMKPDATAMSVETSLWEGADPNVADLDFGYLFIRAANQMSTSIVRLLLEYGADMLKTGVEPYGSALHAAVLGNRFETVQYLIEIGADTDVANAQGETPLQLALTTPHAYPIAKHLLEAGADVGSISLRTVVTASRVDSRERSMMVELLLANGVEEGLDVQGCARRGKGLSVLGLI